MKKLLLTIFLMVAVLCDAATLTVTNMASMRAMNATTLQPGDICLLQSYYGQYQYDRAGGWFSWHPECQLSDDGGLYIQCSTNAGRWVRILGGQTANAKMWGAYGDYLHDDTDKIQAAINALCINNSYSELALELSIPAGAYIVSKTIHFPSKFTH